MYCKICGDSECKKIEDAHHMLAFGLDEDENGHFHYHDKNCRWQKWECKKGHQFNSVAYNHCWCGWSSQYPDKCNYIFKEKPPTCGYKFSRKFMFTNSKAILNLKNLQ